MNKVLERILYGKLVYNRRELPKYGYKVLIYRFLGLATLGFVIINLVCFHLQLDDPPIEMPIFFAVWLFGYVILKETFLWATEGIVGEHTGEIFAALIIGSFLWMEGYNILRKWLWSRPYLEIPEGYLHITIEVFGLLILSYISAILRANRTKQRKKEGRHG